MRPRSTRCSSCDWQLTALNLASAVDAAVEHLETHPECQAAVNNIGITRMERRNDIMDEKKGLKVYWTATELREALTAEGIQQLEQYQQRKAAEREAKRKAHRPVSIAKVAEVLGDEAAAKLNEALAQVQTAAQGAAASAKSEMEPSTPRSGDLVASSPESQPTKPPRRSRK